MRGDLTQAKPRPASRDTRIAEPRPASTSRPQIVVTLRFLYRRSCTEYVCGRQGLKVGMLPVSFSRTLTRYTPAAHCGRHAGQWPTREECASAAHSTALSRTTSHGAASAAAISAIDSPPARHLAAQQATAAALVAMTTVQHKDSREIESSARVDGAAALSC